MAGVLAPGFADPVHHAQQAFRALLTAMSEPGTVVTVPAVDAPPPMGEGLAAVALTLCDADTPVWLAPRFAGEVGDWLTFHTGAVVVADKTRAQFAFAEGVDLTGLSVGDPVYPDRSATLVAEVAFAGPSFTLEGPGIAGTRTVTAALPKNFAEAWGRNRALYPRGVDLVLADGARLMALPRTTEVSCTLR
ncbi:MAG: phosphonate C-P lyase system protein PhnH [Pseudomonadota bacterium]